MSGFLKREIYFGTAIHEPELCLIPEESTLAEFYEYVESGRDLMAAGFYQDNRPEMFAHSNVIIMDFIGMYREIGDLFHGGKSFVHATLAFTTGDRTRVAFTLPEVVTDWQEWTDIAK